MPRFSIHRLTSKMVDLFCGYGETPIRIIGLSMLFIIICASIYTFTDINFQEKFYRTMKVKA
jgi:hypothetical protein